MAFADGMVVFLDLGSDRYCALQRETSKRLAEALERGLPLSDDVVASLRAARVVTERGGRALAFTAAQAPARDIVAMPPSVPSLLRAALCRRRAAMLLRTRHIGLVVAERRSRNRSRAAPDEEVVRKAAAFAGVRPLAGVRNACLRETLALLLFLGRAGASVDWVFAVKGAPFAAHCWAQLGDQVLNDSADHARGYRPIMVA